MVFKHKDYEHLVGIEILSEALLKNHLVLYAGYVNNANRIIDTLNNIIWENKTDNPDFAELKRRFGWEFNGMKLHEYYFNNLTKKKIRLDKNSGVYVKILKDFGSFDNWEKEFKATGGMRGIGWVMLCLDIEEDRLYNIWINEHDVGYLSGTIPILVMDVFEHAYMVDYGLKKVDYINAFFSHIHWNVVAA